MKLSQYNALFPHDRCMVLYNTFTRNSIVLERSLSELLNEQTESIYTLQTIHPEFYHALVNGGFIIDKNTNETEEVESLRLKNLADKTQYHLTINPTLDCNFHCWYCYESKVKGSEMSPALVDSTISFIDKILNDNSDLKRFHLYFFGGEPLMKFHEVMVPILDAFRSKTLGRELLCTLQITTNGVLLTDEMINFIKSCELTTAFQITFDGYENNHNKSRFSKTHQHSYSQLINTVKALIRNNLYVTLRVNYTQNNIDDLNLIIKEFEQCSTLACNHIIYTPVRIWQDAPRPVTKNACEKHNTTEKDGVITAISNASVYYAMSLGMQVMPINSIDSVRYPCKHSFINAASINYNGDVFKCCARAFNQENKEGQLLPDGQVVWNENLNERILRKRIDVNIPCRNCIIFPICGGGCVQLFKDFKNTEYCLYRYDENSKIEAIKRIVLMM